MKKVCTKCGEDKPLEMFGKKRATKDGRQCWCKECRKAEKREYRQTESGKAVHIKSVKKFNRSERGKAAMKKRVDRYKEKYPEKLRAHRAIAEELRLGRATKPDCCSVNNHECNGRIEGHHPDYSKPLEVIWLCEYHHRKIHSQDSYYFPLVLSF